MPAPTRTSLAALFTACLIAMLWLGIAWPECRTLAVCRAAAGLVLVFFWPAALLLRTRLWPQSLRFDSTFHFLSAAVAWNVVGQSAILAAVTALGWTWHERGFALVQSALALVCTAAFVISGDTVRNSSGIGSRCGKCRGMASPEGDQRMRGGVGLWRARPTGQPRPLRFPQRDRITYGVPVNQWAWLAIGSLAIVGYVLLTFKPRGFNEDRYWPLESEAALRNLGPAAAVRFAPGHAWHRIAGRTYRVDSVHAEAALQSLASAPTSVRVALLVEAHREGRLELKLDGRALGSAYAHPRFRADAHTRNYPPPNFLLSARVKTGPGKHQLSLRLDDTHAETKRGHLIVTDLTGLDAAQARGVFDRRYLVANVGDTRENVELARSLFRYPFPRETSYAGEIFDGGGYAISNLPFPYYPYALALLACGDSVASLGWLHLAMLLGMWAAVRTLGRVSADARCAPWLAEALCLLSILAYASLMRFMIESVYVHTTLTLVFLLACWHFLRGHRAAFLAYAAFTALTKGGLVLVAMLLGLALVIRPRPWRDTARAGACAMVVCLVLAAALCAFGWATGSLPAWESDFFGDDYTQRFWDLGQMLAGRGESLATLTRAGWELSKHVLAAGGFLAAFCLLGVDRVGLLLAAVALSFHSLICLSDPPDFESWGHTVHPLNYFTPAAALLAAAGLRAMGRVGQRWRRQWPAALLVLCSVIGVVWCRHRSLTYGLSDRLAPDWRAMHASCVNDYLLRRAKSRLHDLRDPSAAAHDARTVLRACVSDGLDDRLIHQKAKAYYTLAVSAIQQRRYSEARAHLEAMVDAWPESIEVYRECIKELPPRL